MYELAISSKAQDSASLLEALGDWAGPPGGQRTQGTRWGEGLSGIPEGWLGPAEREEKGGGLGASEGRERVGSGERAMPSSCGPVSPLTLLHLTLPFAKWGQPSLASPLPGDSKDAKT